jgi:cell division protein FtsW
LQDSLKSNFRHVTERIDTFLHPESASSDDTYQIDQSIIAIGSGGLTGLGLGAGRQKYNYLPEAHNDFVFAIIGEELGFVGTTAVLLLFVLFMLIGVSITARASDSFAAILAGGYTMLISIQAFLNIAVATRTIPATGISLPFFSYGGSSNFFFLIAIGLILSVSRTGQRLNHASLIQRRMAAAMLQPRRSADELEPVSGS